MVAHNSIPVYGLNRRNIELIYNLNPRKHFPLVDNKLLTKKLLSTHNISTPELYHVVDGFHAINRALKALRNYPTFVVKPASGSGGGGILVVDTDTDGSWRTPSGREITVADLRRHFAEILFGVFSKAGDGDVAFCEERIVQDPILDDIYAKGIADIRVIALHNKPVMAMLRIPTDASDGKANLHQGALGVGIDIDTGMTLNGLCKDQRVTHHPDTHTPLAGIQLPDWKGLMELSTHAAKAVPLGYVGVDLVLDRIKGPLILELNARPGLQIQAVNEMALGDAMNR